jgi:hypothetical protein
MNITEILKAKGIDDATITGILDDMKANKIYTASEENLDIRYGKLKTDHEGKLAELTEAQNLIAELKKSTKGQDDLQGKITAYEGQVAQLQTELEQTKLDAAIKVELLSNKALDVDYLTFKLKEKGELALDENGKIKGWDDKIAALKTQFPTQFETAGSKKYDEHKLPDNQNHGGNESDPKSLEDALKLAYEPKD